MHMGLKAACLQRRVSVFATLTFCTTAHTCSKHLLCVHVNKFSGGALEGKRLGLAWPGH